MNNLLRPYLGRFALVFFDDILIYNSNLSGHIVHLQIVFNFLELQAFVASCLSVFLQWIRLTI